MKYRFAMVIIAVILGLIAAYGVFLYTIGLNGKVKEQQKMVKVLVAEEDIGLGIGMKEMKTKGLAGFKKVPQKYIAKGAISSSQDLDGQVLAVPVREGEQITVDRFQYNTKAGLAFTVPEENVAISISVDEVKGVSGLIKAGDLVNIIATLDTGRSDDETKTLLQKVRVLAVNSTIAPPKGRAQEPQSGAIGTGSSQSQSAKKTVTFSLSAADAEKLVLVAEKGSVWLSLLPAPDTAPTVTTPGQTKETVFK